MFMISRISASFVLILVFLTLIGHACELPIGLALAAHAHDAAHDSSDHHADETQFECDAVLAVRPSPQASSNVDFEVRCKPHPVPYAVALHVPVVTLPDSEAGRRRPPLFLLHAALLI